MEKTFSRPRSQRGAAGFAKSSRFVTHESSVRKKGGFKPPNARKCDGFFLPHNKAHIYLSSLLRPLRYEFADRDSKSVGGSASSRENRASRSTSLLTIANRKLADNPHINTPMMLSTGPKVRHIQGRTTSP